MFIMHKLATASSELAWIYFQIKFKKKNHLVDKLNFWYAVRERGVYLSYNHIIFHVKCEFGPCVLLPTASLSCATIRKSLLCVEWEKSDRVKFPDAIAFKWNPSDVLRGHLCRQTAAVSRLVDQLAFSAKVLLKRYATNAQYNCNRLQLTCYSKNKIGPRLEQLRRWMS